jgi:tRNA(fMet)-specific endonuclease VapC
LKYLLDTNTCVYAIKRLPTVIRRMEVLSPEDLGVTVITLAELWFGARKSSRPERTRASVDAFLRPFEVVPLDREAAESYADIRLHLAKSGRPIGERDLLIAAIARSRDLKVVTHHVGEFGGVPGLGVEDWL